MDSSRAEEESTTRLVNPPSAAPSRLVSYLEDIGSESDEDDKTASEFNSEDGDEEESGSDEEDDEDEEEAEEVAADESDGDDEELPRKRSKQEDPQQQQPAPSASAATTTPARQERFRLGEEMVRRFVPSAVGAEVVEIASTLTCVPIECLGPRSRTHRVAVQPSDSGAIAAEVHETSLYALVTNSALFEAALQHIGSGGGATEPDHVVASTLRVADKGSAFYDESALIRPAGEPDQEASKTGGTMDPELAAVLGAEQASPATGALMSADDAVAAVKASREARQSAIDEAAIRDGVRGAAAALESDAFLARVDQREWQHERHLARQAAPDGGRL